MTPRPSIPAREDVGPDDPLRLDTAAQLGFPDGSMKASGLKTEARRGRLVIFKVAGKTYTTLGDINRMRELCRAQGEGRGYGCAAPAETSREESRILPFGSSATVNTKQALDAATTIVEALKNR